MNQLRQNALIRQEERGRCSAGTLSSKFSDDEQMYTVLSTVSSVTLKKNWDTHIARSLRSLACSLGFPHLQYPIHHRNLRCKARWSAGRKDCFVRIRILQKYGGNARIGTFCCMPSDKDLDVFVSKAHHAKSSSAYLRCTMQAMLCDLELVHVIVSPSECFLQFPGSSAVKFSA